MSGSLASSLNTKRCNKDQGLMIRSVLFTFNWYGLLPGASWEISHPAGALAAHDHKRPCQKQHS